MHKLFKIVIACAFACFWVERNAARNLFNTNKDDKFYSGELRILEHKYFMDENGTALSIKILDGDALNYISRSVKKAGIKNEVCLNLKFVGRLEKFDEVRDTVILVKLIHIDNIEC